MAKSRETAVLTADDYDAIVSALRGLEDVPGVIAKARKCGVNCDEHEKTYQYARDALTEMQSVWFPKGRPK